MNQRMNAHGVVAAISEDITMMQETAFKRWTAKSAAELIKQIFRGQPLVPHPPGNITGPRLSFPAIQSMQNPFAIDGFLAFTERPSEQIADAFHSALL